MVHLAVVRGFTYNDMAQVRSRWLVPTYGSVYRWTGNRTDAEDLTEWIFRNVAGYIRTPELVQVVDQRLAELTSDAIVRHWSERYSVGGVHLTASTLSDSRPTLDSLMTDLTAEMHLTLVLRFVRRRPAATIANQLHVSVAEAHRRVFVALAQVAERIGFQPPPSTSRNVDLASGFVADLVARRRPARFAASGTWPVMVAACHVLATIAGNDLPTRSFVRSLESSRRLVTELRIWSA